MSEIYQDSQKAYKDQLTVLSEIFSNNGFNFSTKSGLSLDDLEHIVTNGEINEIIVNGLISFEAFKKEIKHDIFNDDSDIKPSELNWDAIEEAYASLNDAYYDFKSLQYDITINLTGEQTLDNVMVWDRNTLVDALIAYLEDNELLNGIDHIDGDTFYICNESLEKKLKPYIEQ